VRHQTPLYCSDSVVSRVVTGVGHCDGDTCRCAGGGMSRRAAVGWRECLGRAGRRPGRREISLECGQGRRSAGALLYKYVMAQWAPSTDHWKYRKYNHDARLVESTLWNWVESIHPISWKRTEQH